MRPYLDSTTRSLRDYHGGQGNYQSFLTKIDLGIPLEMAFSEIWNFVEKHPSELVYILLQNFLDHPRCFGCEVGMLASGHFLPFRIV